MKLYQTLEQQLKKEPNFVTDNGELKKWVVLNKAQNFDEELVKYPTVTYKQMENIQNIIILIDTGKYTNLPSDIDKIQKQKLNLILALVEIDKIVAQYNVDLSDAQKSKYFHWRYFLRRYTNFETNFK